VIAWQNPAAFATMVALAGPIAIHLLQRQRARRVAFPTARFIRPSVTGAVRLRLPADMLLLALRLAIVGAAVCAVARPVLVTRGRMRAWDARIARAIVVDVSESLAAAAPSAAEEANLETRSATAAVRIDSADLADGISRAAAALATAPPARREIVVVSDFQRGALTERAIRAVPESVGLRLVRVGSAAARRQVTGPTLFAADGRPQRVEIAVDADRTGVALVPAPPTDGGLQVSGASDQDGARLMKVVASSGTPASSSGQPVVVTFGEGPSSGPPNLGSRWMLETVLRLRRDPELSDLGADGAVIRARGAGSALQLNVDAAPDSYLSAAVVRGVLAARYGDVANRLAEHEVGTIPDDQLRVWSREAEGVSPAAWRHANENDARWFWGIALALLGIETFVRARGPR
jgi:Aerotolerance regulator N-terminal